MVNWIYSYCTWFQILMAIKTPNANIGRKIMKMERKSEKKGELVLTSNMIHIIASIAMVSFPSCVFQTKSKTLYAGRENALVQAFQKDFK